MKRDRASLASRIESLRAALAEHEKDTRDSEGRSALELLVVDIQTEPGNLAEWRKALVRVVERAQTKTGLWWQSLEFAVAMANLGSSELADQLELIVAGQDRVNAIGRASIYAILAECDRPLTAEQLNADQELRAHAPKLWLDLILPVIPSTDTKQSLVVDAARKGVFTARDFGRRLDEMRSVGGKRIGKWLRALGEAFPQTEKSEFQAILKDAGLELPDDLAMSKSKSTTSSVPLGNPFSGVKMFGRRARENPRSYPPCAVA